MTYCIVCIQWQDGSVTTSIFTTYEAANDLVQLTMSQLENDEFTVADGYEEIADHFVERDWKGEPSCLRMDSEDGEVVIIAGKSRPKNRPTE